MKKSDKKRYKCFLTLDLGNTSVSAGVFVDGKLKASARFLYDSFPKNIYNWVKSGGYGICLAVFCSVNPRFNPKLKAFFRAFFPKTRVFQLKNGDIPINNRYKNKNQVGVDRLVNVFGAGKMYGFPCLVIDIGTAITFDIGGPDKSFEGGLIFAGPNLTFDALQHQTAKIGKFPLEFSFKRNLMGKSTRECVTQGIAFGYGNLIRGIIDEFRKFSIAKWKREPKVVVTGGYLNVIKPYLTKDDECDEFITLKAIARLQEEVL
ncbi:MAG: type III pantothenate kinase [Candidatus Omnitrophica bacterium]|nr:type III pantothenate kinase [Candidatus Omnitrophota bacterium]